jgi:beta-D-xylosidase 4
MSDCGAIENQFTAKHTATSYADATTQSILAGTDWCMGTAFITENGLADALAAGTLTEANVDTALTRSLSMRFRLGMFDAPPNASPLTSYGLDRIHTPAAAQAAEDAASQGAVLLRNLGSVLPLLGMKSLKSIAVVGPHAISQRGLLGDFYGDAFCPGINNRSTRAQDCVPTIAASLINVLAGPLPEVSVLVAEGVGIVSNDTSGVAAAMAAVAIADVIILAVGYDNANVEHEGADHTFVTLPAIQTTFSTSVMAAAAARGVPVIMILVNAGQIALDTLPLKPDALIEAFYPAFGAPALARLIVGVESKWGRLPYTLYESSFADRIALEDMNVSGTVGRTWRYYTGSPNAQFGDGLSYASFSLACTTDTTTADVTRNFSISVSCASAFVSAAAGLTVADEILLVKHRVGADVTVAVNGTHPIPFGTLRDFNRLSLSAGAGSSPSSFTMSPFDFGITDASGATILYPGTHYIDVSPRAPGLSYLVTITLTGTSAVVLTQPPPLPQSRNDVK